MTYRSKKLTLFNVVLFVLLAVSVASAQNPVTIHVMDAMGLGFRDAFLELIAEFEQEYPHIKVETQRATSYVDASEKFIVSMMGGTPPNILHLSHARSFDLRWTGAFMPINDYIANDPSLDLDDFYPPFLETVMVNGNIYGIPYTVSTPIAYVWPETLSEAGLEPRAPETWDEIVEFGRRLRRDIDGDGNPDQWGMDITREPDWLTDSFIGQAGGTMISADLQTVGYASDAAVRALEFLQDGILVEGFIRYPGAPTDEFYGGRLGWAYRTTAGLPQRIQQGREWMHPITAGPMACDVECFVPIGGGGLLAVDTGTEAEREASYLLLSFLARPENVARFAVASGYMAVRRSALLEAPMLDALSETPEYQITYAQLVNAHPQAQGPAWASILDAVWKDRPNVLDPLFINGAPVRTVLEEAARTGNRLMAEFLAQHPNPAHPPR